ncbi:Uu.00g018950.m01.CDS01 [Anthostomella pinea]|uniref:Uu.00g018950.m01.CDS01 n=1 Tax=Anthostomella pinea TaxID=933095 RepID=A0AAI8YQS4_9PEZI|nr:Uu.00g018950.m01.CDS01 [Anthostomella pinea]
MAASAGAHENLLDITITTFSSPEPDNQRGRKRRRSSPQDTLQVTATQIPSGESATFRGRCRHRSTSRFDMSRTPSSIRRSSLSPTRRKLLRVLHLNRHRSQSPSRSRSPYTQDPPKRRRQRTRSRSRDHNGESKTVDGAVLASFARPEIVIRSEGSAAQNKEGG